MVPLFNFLVLRGRCRNCKTKISFQYPLVEFATALIFAALFLKFQDLFFMNTLIFAFTLAYYATMFSLLMVISFYDLRHKIIPDTLSAVFGILAFLGMFLFSNFIFFPHFPSLLELLSCIFIAL